MNESDGGRGAAARTTAAASSWHSGPSRSCLCSPRCGRRVPVRGRKDRSASGPTPSALSSSENEHGPPGHRGAASPPAGSGCGRAHAFPPLGLRTGCSPTQNAVPSRPARRPPCCRQGSVTCRPREALPNHPVGQTPLTVRGHGWVSFLPGQKSLLAFPPQRVTSRWVCCGHCWAPGPRTVSGHARGLASW